MQLGPQTKEVIEPPRDVSELAEGDKEKEQQPRSELSSRFKSNRPLSSPNLAHELKGALFARAQCTCSSRPMSSLEGSKLTCDIVITVASASSGGLTSRYCNPCSFLCGDSNEPLTSVRAQDEPSSSFSGGSGTSAWVDRWGVR